MDPERRHRLRHLALAWALVVLLALGLGWERLAAGYAAADRGLRTEGAVTYRAAANLARTRAELPPPAAPRVVLLGSSQIATVIDGGTPLPGHLPAALAREGWEIEVVDFSAGGQKLIESMAVWVSAAEPAHPTAMVIGLSVFSMMTLNVRETLAAEIDGPALRRSVARSLPPGTDPAAAEPLVAFSRQGPQRVSGRGETVQQRIDRQVGLALDRHFDAVANRQTIFRELVDLPVRRDLKAWLVRSVAAARTARTYDPNEAYEPSLLALEVMGGYSRSLGVPMLVVLLPFDHTRPPVPFRPETMERVRADVAAASERSGFVWADVSDLLGSEHFGSFVDGSPDNLHFDTAGHVLLADAVAPHVAALLAARAD